MTTIRTFEDIEVWQLARQLSKEIYAFTVTGGFSKDFRFKDQINAASGSVMDNIAEGFGRGGRNEFINFLGIASGSLNETKSQLYRALDRDYITQDNFNILYALADLTGNKLGRFMIYLNSTEHKGSKFKDRIKQ
jgi:four helix bundle protein